MSGDRLREELDRVGAGAPVVAVAPEELWKRARRSRRRDRARLTLVVAATVAVTAGVTATTLTGPTAPPVSSEAGLPGLPDRLHDVPRRMSERRADGTWARSEVRSDLGIGRAAAAWTTPEGLPVLVDADDGTYHLMDLPGFSGNDPLTVVAAGTELGLALAPDGGSLAYAYGDPGPDDDDRPVPSGIRVADLGSGAVREVPLTEGEGMLVRRIRFSADGRWLVWIGERLSAWTQAQVGGRTVAAGRVAPGDTRSEPVPAAALAGVAPGTDGDLDVSDDGTVVATNGSRLSTWDGRRVVRTTLDRPGAGPVALSADGSTLAVRGTDGAAVVDVGSGRSEVTSRTPVTSPVGWVGDRVVTLTVPYESDSGPQLLLGGPDDTVVVAAVDIDQQQVETLSVAVDLVRPDRVSVARPEPTWPWSAETRATLVAGAVAAGLGVVGGLLWWRLRRRRQDSWSRR